MRHLSYRLYNQQMPMLTKFMLHRDRTFFYIISLTGDRAGDLGALLTDSLHWLPQREGVFFTLTKGKTIDIRNPRTVVLTHSDEAEFCAVHLLMAYLQFCSENNIDLKHGYLFRPLNNALSGVNDKPLSSSTVNSRLKGHLQHLNIFDGETPHGTRSACALTLTWLGVSSDEVKSHVGWKSDAMLKHYTSTNAIHDKSSSVGTLSHNVLSPGVQRKIDLYKSLRCSEKVVP
ncbi:MAG: tyrosine-type recombinase/integrase [Sedimenticola sp.]